MDFKNLGGVRAKTKVSYNPFESGPLSRAVPTTEAQREIWASVVMDEAASLCYNEVLAIDFEGPLERETLTLAFSELVKNHDSLRSVFSNDGKTLFIKEYQEVSIQFLDYTAKSIDELEKIKIQEVQIKFDLINGPCFRAMLIKCRENKHVFVLSIHHIVCDGWSFAVLLSELSSIYESIVNHKKIPQINASQFADFAIDEFLKGINLEHKTFWHKEFSSSLNVKDFPTDFQRPSFRSFKSSRYDVVVPEETVKAIKKLGAINGCSFYSALMSAFNVFLYQLTKSEDIVVGMASASQSGLGQHDLVGHLVNLLPLRMKIDENGAFSHFMKSVRSKMLDAFDHQFYSYGHLVKDLRNIKRDSSQVPLLNVVFNIDQQAPNQGLNFKKIKASFNTVPRDYENFELFINAVSRGDSLVLECQFNTQLFKQSTIESWMSSFIDLMRLVSQDSSRTIKSFEQVHVTKPLPQAKSQELSIKKVIEKRNLEIEEKLKKIWQHVLLNDNLMAEDNFFSVGGHSLLAIELATLIQENFSVPCSIKDIFEFPTIIELSAKIASANHATIEKLPDLIPKGIQSASVSHNQLQIWYLEELMPKTLMHNLPAAIRIKSQVRRDILEKTIHFLIQRHASLRTAIVVENGVPIQKILDGNSKKFQFPLELIKVKEEKIVEVLNAEAQFIFNKENPPLFRAKLYEIDNDDYVFFFMVHHAIWDGWSFDIFFEELNSTYSALIRNEIPTFSKKAEITYIDYCDWLHNLISENKLKNQLDYWENKLCAPLPILDLPLDFKRPLAISHEGGTVPFTLSAEHSQKLRKYAKDHEASLFNVFLTAFKITLSRYSGLDDVIVGLPVRGRNRPEIMQTIGYFVNSVALRTHIDLNQSFEVLLKRVTENCVEAFDNQLIPFQIVLNKVNHSRDTSRTPVFQTFFSYQDVSNRSAEINGVPYAQINVDKASTHTDLDLWIKSSDKKIEGAFEYRKDLFKAISIERFYESFLLVLEEICLSSHKPLVQLRSIPQSLEELILKEWNNTYSSSSDHMPLHKVFEKNAQLYPNSLAIEMSDHRMTYGELNKLANRCANALVESGVRRGDLVGVSLSRGVDLIASLFGILKTGAAYVPLDPGFPQDRLDYMLKSSSPKALITDEVLAKRFGEASNILLVSSFGKNESSNHFTPVNSYSLTDSAYIIYTSGSTGNPKGVELTHASVSNFLESMKKIIGCEKNDKLLAVTTLSFDIAVLELFLPLTSGGSVFLATSSEAMDGDSLKKILETKNISIMQATPSTWRLLLASGWRGESKIKLLCGGEPFPIDLAKKLIPICSSVWNMYGPTETTVWSTCKKLSLSDEIITIGKPIDNTSVYILDENHSLKPIGASGELYIGGLGLAKGYFGRDDLTAERFVPDPFIPGKKMYATGDLARFTYNGEIECLGRNDGQVKVRGYRIELGEIEAEIQKCEEVKEVAVITSEYRPGDVRIFSYVSLKAGAHFDERLIREKIGRKLPSYMIPSHFKVMQDIPKTLNGKIDKKSLPRVTADSRIETSSKSIPEEKSVESFNSNDKEALRLIWQDVLGVDQLNDRDNFFNIGGNSLLAVSLFSKISSKYKINIPLSLLIEAEDFHSFYEKIEPKISKKSLTLKTSQTGGENINVTSVPSIAGAFKSLVTINTNGDKNPFFCFHGVGGNVLNYVSLIPAIKNERPLIGVQSIGLDAKSIPLRSIEEMARHYIREIKMVQPEGPYLLGGGSMGGLVAYEAALQLTRSGDKVEKLIMFDTFGPNFDLKDYTSSSQICYFTRVICGLKPRVKKIMNKFQVNSYRAFGISVPLAPLLVEIERKNYEAIWNYRPKESFAGDLYLIRSKIQESGWYSDPYLGWNGLIQGEIKTFEIEGNHEDFIERVELVNELKKIL